MVMDSVLFLLTVPFCLLLPVIVLDRLDTSVDYLV